MTEDCTEANFDHLTEAHVLDLVVWPDERLHQECETVTEFHEAIDQLCVDLFKTMKHNNGIGLAAPQVGVNKRICAVWIEEDKPFLFINPEIVATDDEEFEWEEGCLSVPGYFEYRTRPNMVAVRYNDVCGNEHETEYRGLTAFAIQHEMDHLDGRVFVDDLSDFKKGRIKTKVQKTLKKMR